MRMPFASAMLVLLAPLAARAADFGDVGGMSNQQAIQNLIGAPQAEAETRRLQLQNQMLQMDLEDRRAQRSMRCQLPDGRRVECR